MALKNKRQCRTDLVCHMMSDQCPDEGFSSIFLSSVSCRTVERERRWSGSLTSIPLSILLVSR